jgi:mannose-6-phosphate isomerase-like protein (cupin superfamily)
MGTNKQAKFIDFPLPIKKMEMSGQITKRLEAIVLDILHGRKEYTAYDGVGDPSLEVLPVLAKYLSCDLPIEALERCEVILKAALYSKLSRAVSGETARQVAQFQKSIGFLLKYKSYSIKCASPLGYSVFLQNQGEGFSFQQHISHKTEVFHILDVQSGGFVFLCDYEDWLRYYDKDSFTRWLRGEADERYDQFKFEPRPGDIFTIDKLGVVHSVVGCILEEFATVSTDMVDRLHDQNAQKSIPSHFNRQFAHERLRSLCPPLTSRHVTDFSQSQPITEIAPVKMLGGQIIPLSRSSIRASRYIVYPSELSDFQYDSVRATSLHVTQGAGQVIIGDNSEVNRLTPPTILVSHGDLLLIPAGVYYAFVSEAGIPLNVSEHKIALDVAFI